MCEFRTDLWWVYARINQIVAEDPDSAHPKYKQPLLQWNRVAGERTCLKTSARLRVFGGPSGKSRDENAEWLKEIEKAIRQRVPLASQEEWGLETVAIAKVISTKRNWCAPGPDRVVNFWWKRACAVHEDVKISFNGISESLQAYPEWFAQGESA